MSHRWKRAPATTLCGFCRQRLIPKGEPAMYRQIPGVKRELVRCQDCASEKAPDDLPPLHDKEQTKREIADFAERLRQLRKNAKAPVTERNWYETERE